MTPETTKEELSEFLTVRENWSTELRMIDYLNARTVTEMARHLPDEDKLGLWLLKPELIEGFNAVSSLDKFSEASQKKILDTVKDPVQRTKLEQEKDNKLIGGVHVSIGLMGGGNVDPDSIDITGNFGVVRRRRICSHEDNRRFFPTQERFRSCY